MDNVIYPLLGGILIGFSSSTMLGGLGRITGISGILSSALSRPKKEDLWRYLFILGLLLGGFLVQQLSPELFEYEMSSNKTRIILAGLLVGFGTRLGGGCTSGHGVCGLSRLAKRSFIATLTFIGFGILTVSLERLFS